MLFVKSEALEEEEEEEEEREKFSSLSIERNSLLIPRRPESGTAASSESSLSPCLSLPRTT